ncbi:terminase gpP N-terminus-related DNA-binding protein [Streptomyces sp. NBC_00467]|uniref:terminase gpP N-terminus-related DNA-binding protein n=1 Tax=Streptomyces sp. NBC_00467 TaxID=2975752 RepID=UPI003FA685DE
MGGRRGCSRTASAGWRIPVIARHLGTDRKTIRAYRNGERTAGRRRQAPDAFVPSVPNQPECRV